jgi:hypothetical protein
VPPCDGLPRYTNGSPGGYVERYSFRAQFLQDCEEELGDDLLATAYESKLPDERPSTKRSPNWPRDLTADKNREPTPNGRSTHQRP